jgi:hypothetical protein
LSRVLILVFSVEIEERIFSSWGRVGLVWGALSSWKVTVGGEDPEIVAVKIPSSI